MAHTRCSGAGAGEILWFATRMRLTCVVSSLLQHVCHAEAAMRPFWRMQLMFTILLVMCFCPGRSSSHLKVVMVDTS